MQEIELKDMGIYIEQLTDALRDMLPENCGLEDDPSGKHRPSFEKCERARDLLSASQADPALPK